MGGGRTREQRKALRNKETKELDTLRQRISEDYDENSLKTFEEFPLSTKTKKGLTKHGFVRPTRIQKATLKPALAGKDVLGAAKTGSGKTLAFLIPVVEALNRELYSRQDGVGALVISPTQELAQQTYDTLVKVACMHEMSCGLAVGGSHARFEWDVIGTRNIIVCTPGRILQHMDENQAFSCDNLKLLVLDEADRMLDAGFKQQLDAIISNLPADRQTLLFSATMDAKVEDLARLSLRDPFNINVHKNHKATPNKLQQCYVVLPLEEKINMLFSFIKSHTKTKTIVFASCRKQVSFLHKVFAAMRPGVSVFELLGKRSPVQRQKTLKNFSKLKAAVLLATDVAARGLDIPGVAWVIQLDCPEDVDTYIHRVGRTARFGKSGSAMLFLTPAETRFVKLLEKRGIPIEGREVAASSAMSVTERLRIQCATDPDIQLLAKKYFMRYLQALKITSTRMKFPLDTVNLETFALSLGLASAPRVKFFAMAAKKSASGNTVGGADSQSGDNDHGDSDGPADGDEGEGRSGEEVTRKGRGMKHDGNEREGDESDDSDTVHKPQKPTTRFHKMMARKNQDFLSEGFTSIHDSGEQDEDFFTHAAEQTHLALTTAPSDTKHGGDGTILSNKQKKKLQRMTKASVLKRTLGSNTRYTFTDAGDAVKVGPTLAGIDVDADVASANIHDDTAARLAESKMAILHEEDKMQQREKIRQRKLEKKLRRLQRQRDTEDGDDGDGDGRVPVVAMLGGASSDDDSGDDASSDSDGGKRGGSPPGDDWLLDEDDAELLPRKKTKRKNGSNALVLDGSVHGSQVSNLSASRNKRKGKASRRV